MEPSECEKCPLGTEMKYVCESAVASCVERFVAESTPGPDCPYKTIERLMGLLVEVNDGFNLWPDSLYKRVSEELAKWN